ncbi:uncharacterized protein BDR25DRAFT_306166 [Lindgomyces ingoldianus]|uniref:Uncharacterized protein n=1 Tax=Lindgomyces ingoldianus TaxID=673940 RepID=A0ACB6QIK6_9PLEO|nr:uncharacterized protein BDR25DRAFT_306166 [Lindgomyces ingoldianus]KAF2466345.1 hypothetical protein BDR25DRAFT_306166 [Lindgomyces ingoldianus]
MSPILSALFFAASVTAQITTSMWMPGGNDDEVGFYGSVVAADNNGKTTLAIMYDNDTDPSYYSHYKNNPQTVTIGETWFESVVTTTANFYEGDMTVGLTCEVEMATRAKPTCTYSMGGKAPFSSYCEDYSTYTEVYTTTQLYTYRTGVRTYIQTYDESEYIPSFCLTGSTLPKSIAIQTIALSRSMIGTYQLVITAGQEKLAATTGATPTVSGAQITGLSTATSSSTSAVNTGAASSPNGTASAPPLGTGAAASIMTMAPALAGLGAAIAVFL